MRYSQSDFPAMHDVGLRLVYVSLTPIERGFFDGGGPPGLVGRFGNEAARWAVGITPLRVLTRLARGNTRGAALAALAIVRNRGPLRRLLHRVVMGYPPARVAYLMSEEYDYWDEFEREYAFVRAGGGDRGPELPRYDIVSTLDELDATLASEDGRIAVILTIEGAHAFSIGAGEDPVDAATLFERIEALKQWPHPVLFVTFAHHFDNGLCGHARSLLDAASLLMDQSRRMNEGFVAQGDVGRRAVRELLELDEDLRDRGGPRVLIDSKHMSARTRRQFYDEIIEPALANRVDGDRPEIPVIFSHAGYSGVRTLAELERDVVHENDHWNAGGYNAWSINLCDDDVRMVHRTRGLIGLCLDRRIAGLRPGHRLPRERHGRVVANQVFGFVDVVLRDRSLDDEARARIWDCISLGTDYDGAIQPLAAYATVADLPALAADLRTEFEEHASARLIGAIGVDVLLEKILWRNAHDFARRHLPHAR